MGGSTKEYRAKYYLANKEKINAKSKKRHKKTYVPRKRKTAMAKEVELFKSFINENNININFE